MPRVQDTYSVTGYIFITGSKDPKMMKSLVCIRDSIKFDANKLCEKMGYYSKQSFYSRKTISLPKYKYCIVPKKGKCCFL